MDESFDPGNQLKLIKADKYFLSDFYLHCVVSIESLNTYLLSDFLLREKGGPYYVANIHYFRHYAEREQRRHLGGIAFL